MLLVRGILFFNVMIDQSGWDGMGWVGMRWDGMGSDQADPARKLTFASGVTEARNTRSEPSLHAHTTEVILLGFVWRYRVLRISVSSLLSDMTCLSV